jgi:hypothetical protein
MLQQKWKQQEYNTINLHISESGRQKRNCFHSSFLRGVFFDPEYGGDIFLRNMGLLLTEFTALYPRRQNSSEHEHFLDTFFETVPDEHI